MNKLNHKWLLLPKTSKQTKPNQKPFHRFPCAIIIETSHRTVNCYECESRLKVIFSYNERTNIRVTICWIYNASFLFRKINSLKSSVCYINFTLTFIFQLLGIFGNESLVSWWLNRQFFGFWCFEEKRARCFMRKMVEVRKSAQKHHYLNIIDTSKRFPIIISIRQQFRYCHSNIRWRNTFNIECVSQIFTDGIHLECINCTKGVKKHTFETIHI